MVCLQKKKELYEPDWVKNFDPNHGFGVLLQP